MATTSVPTGHLVRHHHTTTHLLLYDRHDRHGMIAVRGSAAVAVAAGAGARVSNMRTQAVSTDAAHCWLRKDRCLAGLVDSAEAPIPIYTVTSSTISKEGRLAALHGPLAQALAESARFRGRQGDFLLLHNDQGRVSRVLLGVGPGPTAPAPPAPTAPPTLPPAPTPTPTLTSPSSSSIAPLETSTQPPDSAQPPQPTQPSQTGQAGAQAGRKEAKAKRLPGRHAKRMWAWAALPTRLPSGTYYWHQDTALAHAPAPPDAPSPPSAQQEQQQQQQQQQQQGGHPGQPQGSARPHDTVATGGGEQQGLEGGLPVAEGGGVAVATEGVEEEGDGEGEAGGGGLGAWVKGRDEASCVALGWALGCYSFDRYKSHKAKKFAGAAAAAAAAATATTAAAAAGVAEGGEGEGGEEAGGEGVDSGLRKVHAKLVWPEGCHRQLVSALASGSVWARDLINTPAEDMGTQHLAAEAAALAAAHGAALTTLVGDELLEADYPAIHTVGRAAQRPPLLLDLTWQRPGSQQALPLVSLVGKGVCFDSGGLDIKSASGMKLMKKDMGGAALLLALSHCILSLQLPVRLRLLVPAVENAISGNAYRPGDVLRTRAGITVENGNTDAEGRLILCDALYEAASQGPDLLVDAATLTGAARTALGPDLPAVFTNCDDTWGRLERAALQQADPVWRLPLHAPYRKTLDSKVADLCSTGGDGAQGGAILAALYLQEFVEAAPSWVHIDTPAWATGAVSGPGRPEGGDTQALRALLACLIRKYSEQL